MSYRFGRAHGPARGLKLGLVVLMLSLGLGLGIPAQAAPALANVSAKDKAKARTLFKAGIALFNDGEYIKALAQYKKALKLYPSPNIHTRIAQSYKYLGNNLKALEHYEIYLKANPKPPEEPRALGLYRQVKMRVKDLVNLVSSVRVEIRGPTGAEVRLNGTLVGTAPLTHSQRLNPGPVNVTAIAKGYYAFKSDFKLFPSQNKTVRITMIKIKTKTRIIVKRAKPVWKRWWFWTAIGALVAGGTGLALGLTLKPDERPLQGTPINHDSLTVRW